MQFSFSAPERRLEVFSFLYMSQNKWKGIELYMFSVVVQRYKARSRVKIEYRARPGSRILYVSLHSDCITRLLICV